MLNGAQKGVTLQSLRNGGVLEVANKAIQDVVDNIANPDTQADGVREVTIKVKFKPTKDRSLTAITFSVQPKLQPVAPVVVNAALTKAEGANIALEIAPEQNPAQHVLPGVPSFNVLNIPAPAVNAGVPTPSKQEVVIDA